MPMKTTFGISTRSALLFLMSCASIEGTIQLYYSIYIFAFMNIALVLSGLGCLYSRGKHNAMIYCRVALSIWFSSAMIGLGLGIYFILHGHEKLKEWCVAIVGSSSGEEECSASLLAPWYAGLICLGFLFGLPFMCFAVKTVHSFYLDSLENYCNNSKQE